ncbi:hypothetical protein [Dactylosporangium sp. CA-092794]|uniref:hypothetical protein n=1 Tax=Dactylosporangium sp. CA-092794 TaxID=3239929 RepID=UPI003D8B727E
MEEPDGPVFDEAWVQDAKVSEAEIRRHQTPVPQPVPAPWRTWTPPPQPMPVQGGGIGVGGYLAIVAAIVVAIICGCTGLGLLAAENRARREAAPTAAAPTGPAAPAVVAPESGDAAAPAATVATRGPVPETTAARLPWTPVTSIPDGGPDAKLPEVFATLKVGSCLAETTDLTTIIIVPCSGPHTDEVTLVRDLTPVFMTAPTGGQIRDLQDELCPPAVAAWTGAGDRRYTSGYIWQFMDGVRGFACTAELTGHGPFTGTLRHAAA